MAKQELNPQQKKFCELYATSTEFFGNGVQSYMEAYGIDETEKGAYASARSCAHRMLTNVHILEYIDEILEKTGFSDQFVDKQISFLITQNADFGAKLGAIREYNKLKQRIVDKIDHTTKGEKITAIDLSADQVKKISEDLDGDI